MRHLALAAMVAAGLALAGCGGGGSSRKAAGPMDGQLAVLTTKTTKRLALGARQSVVAAALVEVGLADPVADGLVRALELAGELSDRPSRAGQLHPRVAKLGGYGRWVRGIVDSPSRKPKGSVSTKAGQLQPTPTTG